MNVSCVHSNSENPCTRPYSAVSCFNMGIGKYLCFEDIIWPENQGVIDSYILLSVMTE